jgi:hypothetical protein
MLLLLFILSLTALTGLDKKLDKPYLITTLSE